MGTLLQDRKIESVKCVTRAPLNNATLTDTTERWELVRFVSAIWISVTEVRSWYTGTVLALGVSRSACILDGYTDCLAVTGC